jgi:DNA-binding response OmpR family regulator
MRILVLEDEPRIAELLQRGLSEEGHVVDIAGSLREARRCDPPFDLYIVDRMLPDGDGLDFVRERRAEDDPGPVIVLTARDRVDDRIEGLYGGADDYVTKPFAFDELLARIAAVRRRVGAPTGRITIGDLVIDTEALRVFRAGEEIQLTPQELRLLRYLAENEGKVLTRPRILSAVWDTHHDPGTNLVDVYISYLRAKVDHGHAPLIHTVRGLGYVMEARVP